MLPKVILHIATSLDGRITNFPADLDQYYSIAARWNPNAILFGSETVLAAVRRARLLLLECPWNTRRCSGHLLAFLIHALFWSWLKLGEGALLGHHPEMAFHA